MTQQNLTDMIGCITVHLQDCGKYPSGGVNLVSIHRGETYHRPMVSDHDPENGVEVLSQALNNRQPEAFFTVMNAEGTTRPNGESVDWEIDYDGDGDIGV